MCDWICLLSGILAGLVIAGVTFVFWLAYSINRPLSEIALVAEELARGKHDARVRLPVNTRLGRIGTTVNLLAERFQHDIDELRRLEQVRKEFVANASHELRTPLSAIKAFAETLNSGAIEDSENRLEFVGEIERNADRMTRLVDDLLQLSALESGRMPPVFESVSLMRIAAEVTASLKPLAQKKQIVLRLEPFYDIPDVRADRNQLKQVFTNLLENAVKFTGDKGTVRVTATTQNGNITVSIQDTGCGIPSQDLPHIFERFYRVDKARSRELGGTGLGLSIVKHIVEVHGGSIGVDSVIGQGSTFRFTLPALPA